MAQLETNLPEEEPLDPAFEKVRKKMVRLLAVSIGIMIAGVMAVLAVVVMRVSASSTPELVQTQILLPSGFQINAVSSGGEQMMFFGIDAQGIERALIYDTLSGKNVVDAQIARGAVPQ